MRATSLNEQESTHKILCFCLALGYTELLEQAFFIYFVVFASVWEDPFKMYCALDTVPQNQKECAIFCTLYYIKLLRKCIENPSALLKLD